jgi:hypothetical protein
MTHVGPAAVASTEAAAAGGTSFVEWGSVLAGAVLAAAIAFVLLTFGAAIGLSATSPWPNSGLSAKVIASLAVFWAMAQQIGAFMVGGYVAGRMRSRWREAAQHEVEFRDGLHGGLVWAVGVVISAILFTAAAGMVAQTGAQLAGSAASVAASTTGNPLDAVIDAMVRPSVAQAATPSSPPAAAAPSGPTPAPGAVRPRAASAPAGDENRAEISRMLASAVAAGGLSDQNRAYLAQLVAQRAGVSQADAERRVIEAFNAAREATDKARRAAVLTGFVTAAALVISFAAAWWAAMKGGQHRDNSVPARFGFGDRRRRVAPASTP